MEVLYCVIPESQRLLGGNFWCMNYSFFKDKPKAVELSSARGSTAAFQLVLGCDCDYAVNTGTQLWASQNLDLRNIRVASVGELETQMYLPERNNCDNGRWTYDALYDGGVKEYSKKDIVPVYVELKIPCDIMPGVYTSRIDIFKSGITDNEERAGSVFVTVNVSSYILPEPKDNGFHLDLWQHNSNLARTHEVPLWSDAHFAVIEEYVKVLADLGQKAVTLIVSEIPWAGQSCFREFEHKANLFEYSCISIKKNKDGCYIYDYTVMERLIKLYDKYGINSEYSLYGLVNIWSDFLCDFGRNKSDYPEFIKLRYYDEADGCCKFIDKADEVDAYVKALYNEFIGLGLIDKVRVAADEPGDVDKYRRSLDHVTKVAPLFKFKAAINHAEFIDEFGKEVYDFAPAIEFMCGGYDTLMNYKKNMPGKRFLYYVCCGPAYPNNFVSSYLTESYFLGILTSLAGFDGFLRWSIYTYNADPRSDIRYPQFPAGDLCIIYPSKSGKPMLSLRYKALKRGIEFYTMIEALRKKSGDAAAEKAFDFVVKEKDIRKYYKNGLALTDMCSIEWEDYENLKKYLLKELSE